MLQLPLSASTLFNEHFDAYALDRSIQGQGGWQGQLMVGYSAELRSAGLDLNQSIASPVVSGATRDLARKVSSGEITELSFRAYAPTGGKTPHNAGVYLGASGSGAGWFLVSPPAAGVAVAGWLFDARGLTGDDSRLISVLGGHGAPVRLGLVVDGPGLRVAGFWDFGNGVQATEWFAIQPAQLELLTLVYAYGDFRSPTNLGAQFDDLRVDARVPGAGEFSILDVGTDASGRAVITYQSEPGSRFVLLQGRSVTAISTSVATNVGTLGIGSFAYPVRTGETNLFFRIQRLPQEEAPLTTFASSPVSGESDVSVNRETILRFSNPLEPTVSLTKDQLFATVGGRRLLTRVEVSSDRKTATLFYLEPIPGNSRVRVTFDGRLVKDELGRAIDADADGLAGGVAQIEFDTLSNVPVANTGIIGRVFASELVPDPTGTTNTLSRPLAGVTITVDGAEETLRAVTDSMGNFFLSPCPSGTFFVHIDGRTSVGSAYPNGAYYPVVGKAWEAAAGRTNNLAGGTGEIYLPLIRPGTLQAVSATAPTVVTFPESIVASNPALAGVSLTVPANSLFSENGTRGGRVGIAPVSPDRLPGPLPPGLEFPLVITVQTDGGQNFDQPVPVCFPNLPDPAIGTPLAPGSKQALISFNHDTGQWEAVGTMTVSADGRFVCSDPGQGVLQPGWHGFGPPPVSPPSCSALCCPTEPMDSGGSKPSLAALTPASCAVPCVATGELLTSCIKVCTGRAFEQTQQHMARARRLLQDCLETSTGLDQRECLELAVGIFRACEDLSRLAEEACEDRCVRCEEPLPAIGAQPRLAEIGDALSDPLLARATRLLLEATSILSPYFGGAGDIPPSIKQQVSQLLGQIDAVPGGRFEDYLSGVLVRMGQEIATLEPLTGFAFGNAPARGITYAARISRADSSELLIRGLTNPFGQYSLFVPRDGQLVSVEFFDNLSEAYAIIFPVIRNSNRGVELPRFVLSSSVSLGGDIDRDELKDVVERVLGTDPFSGDSDSDGIPDGVEIQNGTNPLDNLPAATGILFSADTPGTAVDVCAANNIAVVADSEAGIAIFNALNGLNPIRVAQLDTPGRARRISCSGNLVAVADDSAGLCVVDISSPASPSVLFQVPLGASAVTVVAAGSTAFVGLNNGQIVSVDMLTGTVLGRLNHGEASHDLGLDGDTLFVLTSSQLVAYRTEEGVFGQLGSISTSVYQPDGLTGTRRLFLANGLAYVTAYPGYETIDISDLQRLTRVGSVVDSGPNSFKQIVVNGSGLGLAAVGVNPRDDGTHDVYLYDVSDPARTSQFLTALSTPGIAHSVSIYNGLAYVADGTAGLQVINYLPYDNRKTPPTISLSTSLSTNVVEEGKSIRVIARVTDDVQVRNVEFYLDGARVAVDGNFPFEQRLVTPFLTAEKTNFVLRARATDTGGNSAWSEELVLELRDDLTPPRIGAVSPRPNSCNPTNSVSTLAATFNEAVDPSTLDFRLYLAGPDRVFGTSDDVEQLGGRLGYRPDNNTTVLQFATPLPTNTYYAVIAPGYADLAGNRGLGTSWQFDTFPRRVLIRSSTTLDSDNFTHDNCDVVVDNATLTVNGAHSFNSLVVSNNAVLTHSPGGAAKMALNIVYNLRIYPNSRVDADSRGFVGGAGPAGGSGTGGCCVGTGGGGHAGAGGDGYDGYAGGGTYGSIGQPVDLGSSGGQSSSRSGGAGGGAMRLSIEGDLIVDGTLTSNGGSGATDGGGANAGGGAGGSLWITCRTLAGDGAITANGGDGARVSRPGGGGGGGRIALYYQTNSFTGSLVAKGGSGWSIGGAGTIYVSRSGSKPTVLISNEGNIGESTEFSGEQRLEADLVVRNGGIVGPVRGQAGLHLIVGGNVSIETNGWISATARGHVGGSGPGAGSGTSGCCVGTGGAGHAGAGGDGYDGYAGGGSYGSIERPVDFGSSGGPSSNRSGGAGGGALRLTVEGDLMVEGTLSSNGGNGATDGGGANAGGGAGGSLWITCRTLTGDGAITANGGDGARVSRPGGGGGGGRIALYHRTNGFTGSLIAQGGSGWNIGGAGTIFLSRDGERPVVLVSNGGNVGEYTEFSGEQRLEADLVVRNGGIVGPVPGQAGLHLIVAGNVSIETNGWISATARGHVGGSGPGAGSGTGGCCVGTGGAGHAGAGGDGYDGYVGGGTYGSIDQPVEFGSSGGPSSSRSGGAGGGALRLTVEGDLMVDGTLSSNGGNGATDGGGANAGGGAGGSLWIACGTLAGNGAITANGGDGAQVSRPGGGGGAGRVALYYRTNVFKGKLVAKGGSGYNTGGAGTVFLSKIGEIPTILVSNEGSVGETTEFSGEQRIEANLVVRNGGIVGPVPGQSGLHLIFTGNVVVEVGGALSASGRGFASGAGPGAGSGTGGCCVGTGGAGHTGAGGIGYDGYAGGTTYSVPFAPTELGSGGGQSSQRLGGAGGGAIRLTVLGDLLVDGHISSDGYAGATDGGNANAGGGSGGSLWITCAGLSGQGVISADGGDGGLVSRQGGGGGGGSIAIYCANDSFEGTLSTEGGRGYNRGGGGTIFRKLVGQPLGDLLIDRGESGTVLAGPVTVPANVRIKSGGYLTQPLGRSLNLTVLGNLQVDDGASIDVSGRGYVRWGWTGCRAGNEWRRVWRCGGQRLTCVWFRPGTL